MGFITDIKKSDIVDNEPSNGNVWKMLLGSISEHWDNDNSLHKDSSVSQKPGHSMNGHASTSRPRHPHQAQSSWL